jgi:hypothetical protein
VCLRVCVFVFVCGESVHVCLWDGWLWPLDLPNRPPPPQLHRPHLCLWRSSMECSRWYSRAVVQLTVCSTVVRAPSRIVPPWTAGSFGGLGG